MLERAHHQQEVKMSARGVLSMVGTAVGGLIGWNETPPAADPSAVRGLLEDLGMPSGADLGTGVGGGPAPPRPKNHRVAGVRAFQARTGLKTDGIAGPRTVHLLARYAKEARELHRLDLAA
jgi:hypothetical protein